MSYISFIALQETIRIFWFTIFLCFTKLAALAMLKLLSIHMNNIENLLSDPLIKDMEKQKSEALKNLFGNRIKQTFLRSMEVCTNKTAISKDDKTSKIRFAPDELADQLIKNTYKVLLTRGQKGCFIYCEDEALREYLKKRISFRYN